MSKKKQEKFEPPVIKNVTYACKTCGDPFRVQGVDARGLQDECRLCADMKIAHQDIYLWVTKVIKHHNNLFH